VSAAAARRIASSRSAARVLEVRLGHTIVGTLTHLVNESTVFAFDPAHVDASTRPTLSLGFKGQQGSLVETVRPTRVKLLPFFSNLLPEGHLREYLAARGGVHPEREFFLLWLLGADLPGAVEVRALEGDLPPANDRDEHDDEEGGRAREEPLRFSLAGVQLKFSAIMEARGGLTLPVGGVGGDWIAKLPSPRFDAVPENEYAMMTLAAAAGIDVPEVRLVSTQAIGRLPKHLPEAFGQTLAIRRFDRPVPGQRTHIEDFAQVFGVSPEEKYRNASYGNIARVLWLETGEAGITEYVRRLAFNALIGNADAHLKNWSLIYPDGRTAQLAPAYDLLSTIPYIPDDRLALTLAGTKNFADINSEQFRRLAETAGLPVRLVVKIAQETAEKVRDLWRAHEPLDALPAKMRTAIAKHMDSVPL